MAKKKSKKKHPTVGPQAQIDKIATALVQGWLASGWNVHPIIPNYHEDYIVERIDVGELSGVKISAQQKGHATVIFKKGIWSEQIKTKHLRYYDRKLAMPAFLFLVDTTKRKGYYLFIQRWLDQNVTPAELDKKTKISVHVEMTSDLEDSAGFLAAVSDAHAYMAKRNPGSVEDAIQGDIKKVAALDPRVDVKLDIVDSSKHYTLLPKETIPAVLKVSRSEAAKMDDLIGYGMPARLPGAAVAIEGLPIFDELLKTKHTLESVAIRPTTPRKVEFSFWTEEPGGFRFTLPGSISGATLGLAFISDLPGAPLQAMIKIPKQVVTAASGAANLALSFKFAEWNGKPLGALPYFEKLRGFARAIVEGKLIHHEVTMDGNRVTGGTLGAAADQEPFLFATAVIENLGKAREIAAKLGVALSIKDFDALVPEDFLAVDLAHSLIFSAGEPRSGAGFEVAITLNRKNHPPGEAIANLEALCTQGGITITKRNQLAKIYDAIVSMGDFVYTANPVKLVVPEPGRTEFVEGRADTAPATLASVPETVVTITPVPRAEAG